MTKIPERSEIPEEKKWNLEVLYSNVKQWETDFESIDTLVEPLVSMRGTLNCEDHVLRLYELDMELDRLLHKVYVFAHLKSDEDTANTENQARQNRVRAKFAEISGMLAWITPELLANDMETLEAWRDSDTLSDYNYNITSLIRRKVHTLSDKEETILSKASEIFSAPGQVYNLLTNADMKFPEVIDEDGKSQELSQGRFIKFLQSEKRNVRKDAFEKLYEQYKGVKNTTCCTLSTNIKTHNFNADIRGYDSALHASLSNDNIPVSLYEALIESVHNALPKFYDYVSLRKKRLGIEELNMFDMYAPLVPDCKIEIPFEQARDWVLDACKPLGEAYCNALKTAFTDGWVDVCENRGKRSGAYSSGCYDSLPYVLLNYQGTLDDVFTLAHELGHSMHTKLANESQPPHLAGYPIFIAEIASTLNEALLFRHLYKINEDPKFRAYLLNHDCDSVRGTVYRQTMFAEFEKHVHEEDASGNPLTVDSVSDYYYNLNETYYGPEVKADERISLEWSRIPHFYYNFYVYKYATSFCASRIFVDRVLESEQKREQYLDLLRAGGSADPLDLVSAAGVDLTDPQTLSHAFNGFAETIKKLESFSG